MSSNKVRQHNKANFNAILAPIIVSIILLGAKGYGWIVTDSVSILSSLLDSTMDVIVSIFNISAVIYAAKPADDDHRFGHNAIEDIVGLIQATFIGASALFILYEAITHFIEPRMVDNSRTGVWVMVFSFVLSSTIVFYQRMTIKKTKSSIVQADMMHYLSDSLINIAIISSLVLSSYSSAFILLDPILATLIAFYIMFISFKIGKRSFDHLMDRELSEDEKNKIKKILKSGKNLIGYHELKTRRSGSRVFIQLHVELDRKLTLEEGHDVVQELEDALGKIWNQAEVIIHTDPV